MDRHIEPKYNKKDEEFTKGKDDKTQRSNRDFIGDVIFEPQVKKKNSRNQY